LLLLRCPAAPAWSSLAPTLASCTLETKANDGTNPGNVQATKSGEACSTSILGWVTTGDSSVPAAAKAGGIKNVHSVDNKFVNYVGVYAQYCTVVTGE